MKKIKVKNVLLNKKFQLLCLMILFLATTVITQATTSGNAGIFATLVTFLTNMNNGLKIVFSLGAIGCIGFGVFKMLTDPNMTAIITLLIGVALALALIFGSEDIVKGLGGTMIDTALLEGV